MVRTKTRWVCRECGFQSSGFLGRCSECETWNSFEEEAIEETPAYDLSGKNYASRRLRREANETASGAVALDEIDPTQQKQGSSRLKSGLDGLDEVLGGGLVPGSVILLAGDPGVGKSTLLLQVANAVAGLQKVLYVSGEESASQICLRASRLSVSGPSILVNAATNIKEIQESMLSSGAALVIVDSIQSVYHPQVASAPGSVTQLKEAADALIAIAKSQNIATILVGHVTKEGAIAGPRVLEHMVDVVLHFEGERSRQLRILKAVKNRYGSTAEIAIYSMTASGLVEVENPSAVLLGDRLNYLGRKQAASGTAVISGGEGNSSLLLEVQALVHPTSYPSPRRVANGWDYNRLLQIIAVLERKVGLLLSHHDVYINIVGGLDLSDPSGDLGVAVAIATSFLDRSTDPGLFCLGEIGLTGEVRAVAKVERRLKEAAKLGFTRALVPAGNLPLPGSVDQIEVVAIQSLLEALTKAMPGVVLGKK